jgi:hypothetical protein
VILLHASYTDNAVLEIPFALENRRIVVEAEVNGTSGRFLWDSAATFSAVNCRSDNLRYVDNMPTFWIGGGEKTDAYIINEMTLGGVRVKAKSDIMAVPEGMRKRIFEPEGFDGLLGIEIFNGYWCEISFSQSVITLHKEKPAHFTQSVPASKIRKFLAIPVEVDGTSYRFVIDTGMPDTLVMPPDAIKSKADGDYIKVKSKYNDYYAMKTHSVTVFNDTFKEKYFFTDLPTGVSPLHNRRLGIIGLDALQNYDLLFDLTGADASREMRVYYKPRNEFEDRVIGLDQLNQKFGLIQYNKTPKGITLDLLEGSELFALGVNESTVIIRINGKQTKDMYGGLVWDEPPIHFTILEKGEERTVIY